MVAPQRATLLSVLCLWSLLAIASSAQTEMERERNSLRNIEGFYLSLNVEGKRSVVEQDGLDFQTLHLRLRTRLQDMALPVLDETTVPAHERVPYLHVHVNIMEADRGQLPFVVELRFYQSVRLIRDPAHTTVAGTWGTSLVGLTYAGQLQFIEDTAVDLLTDFIDDFRQVNL